jgi:hypothetical protein
MDMSHKRKIGDIMDFSAAVQKIMTDLENGNTEPLILHLTQDRGWQCDYTQNQYGEIFEFVEDVLQQDPFAVQFTGSDMARGSFPHVCDKLLNLRLNNEYNSMYATSADKEMLAALVHFFEENTGALTQDATDYLTTFKEPLAELVNLCPLDMTATDNNDYYNEELTAEAVQMINSSVPDLQCDKASDAHVKTDADDGFRELAKVSLNNSDIILSENPDAKHRYRVVENRYTQYYNNSGDNNIFTGFTNDYLEALDFYSAKVQLHVGYVKSARSLGDDKYGPDYVELKHGDCLPNSHHDNYTGKLLIIKADALKPEYRTAEHQLFICSHGNGARPNAKGTSVFGYDLILGDSVCFGRHEIEGVADIEKLPKWAKDKIDEHYPELKVQKPNKKPSLIGKLDNAKKETAAKNAERKSTHARKKHRNMEV